MEKVKVTASKEYNVYIGSGFLDSVGEMLANIKRPCRVVVVSDDTVFSLYGERVKKSLEKGGFTPCEFVFPHGEDSKSLETFEKIQEFCAENSITRPIVTIVIRIRKNVTSIPPFALIIVKKDFFFFYMSAHIDNIFHLWYYVNNFNKDFMKNGEMNIITRVSKEA